jgi:hypothetical protein
MDRLDLYDSLLVVVKCTNCVFYYLFKKTNDGPLLPIGSDRIVTVTKSNY